MKLTKSLIFGLECVALVFVSFLLFYLEARFGNPYWFLAGKTLLFAALCLVPCLFRSKENGKREGYFRSLFRSHGFRKPRALDVVFATLAAVLIYFFTAFCYSGAIGFYEAVSGQIAIFGSSSVGDAGTAILSVLLKGILFPCFAAMFYFGKGGTFFGNKKFGTVMLVLYASLIEFSADGVFVLLAVNVFLGMLERKTESASLPVIAFVAYSFCGVSVSLAGTLPYSYTLITSVETAWYYASLSFGIGLVCLAAAVMAVGCVKTQGKREFVAACGEENFVFFGACVFYVVLLLAFHMIR